MGIGPTTARMDRDFHLKTLYAIRNHTAKVGPFPLPDPGFNHSTDLEPFARRPGYRSRSAEWPNHSGRPPPERTVAKSERCAKPMG